MPLILEQLETRCLLSIAPPTAAEQLMLEELNDARANPAAYGQSIGLDLSNVAPSQALAFDPRLIDAARGHSIDMSVQGYFDHNTPSGETPSQRMAAAGFDVASSGESIAAGGGFTTSAITLRALIVDGGVPNLGHRMQLLAIDPYAATHNAVGIGIVLDGSGPLGNYYTIDTASSLTNLPYITGVVYDDANHNGAYDMGEGLGNVNITVAGMGTIQTWSTGGYSFQVGPGIYNVTASGGGLAAPITSTIQIGSQNFRLNFMGAAAPIVPNPFVPKIYQAVLGRQPSTQDTTFWSAVLQSGVSHASVASAIETCPEAVALRVSGWYQTYLGRAPGAQEVSWWTSQLAGGLSEISAEASILGSNEYIQHALKSAAANTPGAQAFIASLYSQVLNRTAGSSDTSYWLANLLVSSTSTVATDILGSVEARSIAVDNYYHAILGRTTEPNSAELAFWAQSALSLEQIRIAFEASAEFS
jgi:uncharacterized protein YkwD